uniref:DUF223 domain-containing protein n=1 Tax=Brassica oleracea var. oleracea TaxID=109376 RepID=A0A0D3CDD1_BRAOL
VLPSLTPPSLTPPPLTPPSIFGSLRLGRAAQSVVARLIRFWDSRNINKNNGFTGITIILLDELARIVLILFYVPSLDNFEVARVAHMYKITEHQFVIRFLPSTRISEVETDAPIIKFDRFM